MAKKAAKISWRTLTRRADKARNPRTASRLRKQAHELRRAERTTKGQSRRTIKSLAREAHKAGLAVQISSIPKAAVRALAALAASPPECTTAEIAAWQKATQFTESPGKGEVVGGADSKMAEKLVTLARKKGGKDAVQNEIMAMRQTALYEGRVEADTAATKRLIEVQERIAERIVCGFISEVDTCVAQHHGLPPAMTWNLNSFLIIKIVDALNKAGYRATGRVNTGTVGEKAVEKAAR